MRARIARLLPFIFGVVLIGCSAARWDIDDKIKKLEVPGASVSEVIRALGKPDEAWGSPIAGDMVFIYQGQKTYSNLFMGQMGMALRIHEGRLGGPDAVPLNERIDVVISGNRIEFRRAR
jgi:hypothetical protein